MVLDRVGDIKPSQQHVDGAREPTKRAWRSATARRGRSDRIDLRAISRSVSTWSATSRRVERFRPRWPLRERAGDRAAARGKRSGRPGTAEGRRTEPRHDRWDALTANNVEAAREAFSGSSEDRPRARPLDPTTPSAGRPRHHLYMGPGRARVFEEEEGRCRALSIAEQLERDGHLSGEEKSIPEDLRTMLADAQQASP